MQTFKKIVLSVISFILVLIIVSAVIIEPMIQMEFGYYSDAKLRKQTAGQYDTLFIGDSDGLTAFVPSVFDEQTGCNSYNLSGTMMTEGSEYYLLEKEIKRNPIKQVFLQISYDSFCRNPEDEKGDGDSITFQRLETLLDRLYYVYKYVGFDDYLNIYSRLLVTGFDSWKDFLAGNIRKCDYSAKGWLNFESNDLSLNEEEALNLYNTIEVDTNFSFNHDKGFERIIKLCKENNIEISVVLLPVSNRQIWKYDGLDKFKEYMRLFCENNNVSLYDFNLLKSKYNILSDKKSYKDDVHMSEEGALAFTTIFAGMYSSLKNDESVDNLFYNSYSEMKLHSPYIPCLKKKTCLITDNDY